MVSEINNICSSTITHLTMGYELLKDSSKAQEAKDSFKFAASDLNATLDGILESNIWKPDQVFDINMLKYKVSNGLGQSLYSVRRV
jgi:hypothetical protein